MTPDDIEMDLSLKITNSDGPEVSIREVTLGLSPHILVRPEVTEVGVTFVVDACDFEVEQLAGVLLMLGEALEGKTGADLS